MIYIACPYWNDQKDVRNYRCKKAIDYSTILIKKGYLVYSPLLYTERFAEDKIPEGYWVKHGIQMVGACREMHILCLDGWYESKGVKGEIDEAKKLGLEFKYIKKHVRLSFHGSRTLKDKRIRAIIEMEIEKHQPEVIVTHGEPEGVCQLSRKIAREQGIPLKLHHLQIKYAGGKFHARSLAVINDSDFSVFIHDGASQGTQNEVAIAKKLKAHFTFHKFEKDKLIAPIEVLTEDIEDVNFDELEKLTMVEPDLSKFI